MIAYITDWTAYALKGRINQNAHTNKQETTLQPTQIRQTLLMNLSFHVSLLYK